MYVNFEEIKRMADSIREICGDDEDTLLDTLDGETDAMDVLGKLIEQRQWAKASQQAAKEMAAQLRQHPAAKAIAQAGFRIEAVRI